MEGSTWLGYVGQAMVAGPPGHRQDSFECQMRVRLEAKRHAAVDMRTLTMTVTVIVTVTVPTNYGRDCDCDRHCTH